MQIRCVVENSAQRSSEFWAEHGVSFHIQTAGGQVLFDTGQSGTILLHNAKLLGVDLGQIDALAISHAHHDHTGGLAQAFQHTRPMIPLYANPDLFRERYTQRGEEYVSIGMEMPREELAERAEVRLSADPVEMVPGVWTTGEIDQRPEFEGRSPAHCIKADGGWQPDPYRDDLSLVLEGEGWLVVLCGCCHAGLLNTLAHVRRAFDGDITAVAGGLHLASATDDMLQRAVNTLQTTYNAPRLYPSHCTGEKAYVALADAFGERVQPCPAGTILTFE
jgi:7,8-dihydropterin-6-yl-methyl-4-(beta-D-ribofuranosyl)aminobenzene 5'-phosphate synthase